MRIGELRRQLAAMPDHAKQVRFDFGVGVDKLGSWRGDYTEATLEWCASRGTGCTVADLLAQIDRAIAGETFEGYKGGDYTFREDTDVYADDYGSANGNRIVSVVDDYCVVLVTRAGLPS